MLRIYLGLSALKRKANDDNHKATKEKNKVYEKTKRKKNPPSWKKEFELIVCDDTRNVGYCKVCRSTY